MEERRFGVEQDDQATEFIEIVRQQFGIAATFKVESSEIVVEWELSKGNIQGHRVSQDHEYFLKNTRQLSLPIELKNILTKGEWEFLKRFGLWLLALHIGVIQPYTNDQSIFVRKFKGAETPEDDVGIPTGDFALAISAWKKYLDCVDRLKQSKRELVNRIKVTPGRREYTGKTSEVCPICLGDGGAGGRCFHCYGTGSV